MIIYTLTISFDEGDERRDSFLDDVTSERSSNFGASPSLTAMDDERMDGDDRWKSRHALVEQKMNRRCYPQIYLLSIAPF